MRGESAGDWNQSKMALVGRKLRIKGIVWRGRSRQDPKARSHKAHKVSNKVSNSSPLHVGARQVSALSSHLVTFAPSSHFFRVQGDFFASHKDRWE